MYPEIPKHPRFRHRLSKCNAEFLTSCGVWVYIWQLEGLNRDDCACVARCAWIDVADRIMLESIFGANPSPTAEADAKAARIIAAKWGGWAKGDDDGSPRTLAAEERAKEAEAALVVAQTLRGEARDAYFASEADSKRRYERAADLERLLWAMANISHHWWDSISEPRIRSGRFCFRSPNLVLRFDLVNGLPQMTHELRVAIDATPSSPFYKADAARGESQ